MTQTTEKFEWAVDGELFEGHAVFNRSATAPKAAVLVCHAWAGQGDFEQQRAAELAELGYVGIAVDVYGTGKKGGSPEECKALMSPLMEDRTLLRRRLFAAVAAARNLSFVDETQIGAIGFCFGGLCVLDLARQGADLRGVVSFHGLLQASSVTNKQILAKVLILHGYDDPMAPPTALIEVCNEMTAAGVDWQLQAYGNTMHAFTNPKANDPGFGTVYQPTADARSRAAMEAFLTEILPG